MTPKRILNGRSYTQLLISIILVLFFLSCSDDKAGGSATDVDTMIGTVVDLSGSPRSGIRAFCYHPDYLPYENDTVLYESVDLSNSDGKYTFKNFAADTSYNILTMNEDTSLAGFRKVSATHFVVKDSTYGTISGADTVQNIESYIPGILFNTSIPIVMQVKGTPFYTTLNDTGYFDQSIPHGMYDFQLSFPTHPEYGVHTYKDIPIPFVNDGMIRLAIPDTVPPSMIGGAVRTELTHSSIGYNWEPSVDSSSLAGYEIRYYPQNAPDLAETLYTAYSQIRIENLSTGTIYAIQGRAKDLFSNYSKWTDPPLLCTTSYVEDSMGPIIERAYVTYATQSSVTVEWTAGVDASPITKYLLHYYKSDSVETTKQTVTIPHTNGVALFSYNIEELMANTRYTLEIIGVDTHGNSSKLPKEVYLKTYK